MAESFGHRLRIETQRWVRDGLVSAEQAEAILARYRHTAPWFARPITIFSVIGGALLAGAAALVIAHHWHEIPRWARLGGVVTLILAAHGGGLTLRTRGYGSLGEGLLVMGGGLLLVGVALVGQLYNLTGPPSDALLLWWVLLLPAAYALPAISLAVLAWAGAGAWYAVLAFDRASWLGRDVHLNGVLGAVAVAAGGAVAWAIGAMHRDGDYRRVRQFLEQLGLLAILSALVPLGFVGTQEWGTVDATRWPVGLLGVLAVATVAVGVAYFALPPDRPIVRAGPPSALLLLIVYLLGFVVALTTRVPAGTLRALAWTNWALLFAVALVLIAYGARWDRASWVNWGVVWIGVNGVARYLELFGTMLQTSVLFFATGLFVLALGAVLEWLRRRVTARTASPREAG
jgi:uncharacterized membrane protein